MKSNVFSKNELIKRLTKVREEISSLESELESKLDRTIRSGYIEGVGLIQLLIESKKDQENRLARDLNNFSMKKTNKSVAWLATITAVIVPIVTLFINRIF